MRRDRLEAASASVWGAGLLALDVVLDGTAKEERPVSTGGSCGNVLSILAWLNLPVMAFGRVGSDPAGRFIVSDLRQLGIGASGIQIDDQQTTPIIIEHLVPNIGAPPTRRFSFVCDSCGRWFPRFRSFTRAHAASAAVQAPTPKIFYFDRASPGHLVLAEQARQMGALIFFEPSAKHTQSLLKRAVQVAHLVKASSVFAARAQLWDAILSMKLAGERIFIETRNSGGLRYSVHDFQRRAVKWLKQRAIPVAQVRDETGAGDWMTAAMIIDLFNRDTIQSIFEDADNLGSIIRRAQAVAAVSCGFVGARGAMHAFSPDEFLRVARQGLRSKGIQSQHSGDWNGPTAPVSVLCGCCSAPANLHRRIG
jgi:sugar/nucleoside kinase (ribokinase family)